jgi:hypothetical protein
MHWDEVREGLTLECPVVGPPEVDHPPHQRLRLVVTVIVIVRLGPGQQGLPSPHKQTPPSDINPCVCEKEAPLSFHSSASGAQLC